MTDTTPLLAELPPGSQLYLHSRTPDDGIPGRPTEVAVFKAPGIAGGCVCYALVGKKWQRNHGERHALALLMGHAPRATEPTTPVRVPAAMIVAAREATGLPSGEAVRKVLSEALAIGSRVEALEARLAALEGGR